MKLMIEQKKLEKLQKDRDTWKAMAVGLWKIKEAAEKMLAMVPNEATGTEVYIYRSGLLVALHNYKKHGGSI